MLTQSSPRAIDTPIRLLISLDYDFMDLWAGLNAALKSTHRMGLMVGSQRQMTLRVFLGF